MPHRPVASRRRLPRALGAALAAALLFVPSRTAEGQDAVTTRAVPGPERVRAAVHSRWAAEGRTVLGQQLARLQRMGRQAATLQARAAAGAPDVPARVAAIPGGMDRPLAGALVQAAISVGFADEVPSLAPAALSQALYGPGTATQMSVTGFYKQASDSLFQVVGTVGGEARLPRASSYYVGTRNPARFGGVADSLDVFLADVFRQADSLVNFASFVDPLDPDGRVAALVIMVAGQGGECGADTQHIWAHRWNATAVFGAPYATGDQTAAGRPIVIDDYILQPINECGRTTYGGPGVVIHETGHLLGLPDLYDTDDPFSRGPVGHWDVMATGVYNTMATPAQLGAWSRAVLGWLAVDSLAIPTADRSVAVTLRPVHASRLVTLLPYGTTEEFLLAESRVRAGTDQALAAEGALFWYVNPQRISETLSLNAVNTDATRPGVAILPGDGRTDLESGENRADAGDVWPQVTNAALDTNTTPPLRSRLGATTPGFRLANIRRATGGQVLFDVVGRLAGPTSLTLTPDTLPRLTSGQTVDLAFGVAESVPAGGEVTYAADTAALAALGLSLSANGRLTGLLLFRATDTTVALTVRATLTQQGTVLRSGTRAYAVRVTGVGDAESPLTVLPATFPAVAAGRPLALQFTVLQADSLTRDDLIIRWHATPAALTALGATLDHAGRLTGTVPVRVTDTTLVLPVMAVATPANDTTTMVRYGTRFYSVTVYGTRVETAARLLDALLDPALAALPAASATFFDALGNGNGRYDLGDFVLAVRYGLVPLDEASAARLAAAGVAVPRP